MPRYHAESYHPDQVVDSLHEKGFKHLRARKHGSTVIVESGPPDAPVKHLRLRRETVHLWGLDFANHRGKWESTPFRDDLDAILAQVVVEFAWTLADISGNPERTSDPEY